MSVTCFLVSLVIASAFACDCSLNESKFEFESCDPGSEKYLQLVCNPTQLFDDCTAVTDCTLTIPMTITSAELEIQNKFDNSSVTVWYGNFCDIFQKDGESEIYPGFSTKCPIEPINDVFIPIKNDISETTRKLRLNGEHVATGLIKISNINGQQGANACYRSKEVLECSQRG